MGSVTDGPTPAEYAAALGFPGGWTTSAGAAGTGYSGSVTDGPMLVRPPPVAEEVVAPVVAAPATPAATLAAAVTETAPPAALDLTPEPDTGAGARRRPPRRRRPRWAIRWAAW